MAKLGGYIQHWALKRAGRDIDWPGDPRTIIYEAEEFGPENGTGELTDLGPGPHMIGPFTFEITDVEMDGATWFYLIVDRSYDGEVWTSDADPAVTFMGDVEHQFTSGVPETVQIGSFVVPQFIRIHWSWGGDVGEAAHVSFNWSGLAFP